MCIVYTSMIAAISERLLRLGVHKKRCMDTAIANPMLGDGD